MRLEGKTALITGATGGIGRAIAETYASRGAALVLHGRTYDRLRELSEDLGSRYEIPVRVVTGDLSDSDAIKAAIREVTREIREIDILVNNAGVLHAARVGMMQRRIIEETYATNVFSVYELTQYIVRLMRRRKRGGSIINITSIMGIYGEEGQAIYSGSKAALLGITRSMARELAPEQIRVNAIAPGFIDTAMTRTLEPQRYDDYLARIGMGRVGTPEDVANAALFLASDLSRYVTGQTLGVDGGMVL